VLVSSRVEEMIKQSRRERGKAGASGVANSRGRGLLFQGWAEYNTRIQILGPGTPNQGSIGNPEFQSLFAN
jgi:hypothetical protein